MRTVYFLAATLVLTLWVNVALAGNVLSCGQKLVRIGDSKAEVFKKCGEPAWRERYDEEWWIKDRDDDAVSGGSIVKEEWVYNFGPTQFLRHLHFENGRLAAIERGEYGFKKGASPGTCSSEELERIDNKAQALFRCGEPMFKDTREETRIATVNNVTRKITITVDEWTYDFGSTRFMRTLIFENGKLVDVKRGDRGG